MHSIYVYVSYTRNALLCISGYTNMSIYIYVSYTKVDCYTNMSIPVDSPAAKISRIIVILFTKTTYYLHDKSDKVTIR